jgi:hypothetical protein
MRIWFVLLASSLAGCIGGSPSDPAAGPDAGVGPGGGGGDAGADASTAPVITVQRGVDRASAFSLTEAKTLATSHGVKWTGVYIGGACNAGSGWTKALVTSLSTQLGWTFMPTFVGQQSPSICGSHTLSAAQGHTDGLAAVNDMKSFGWQPNRKIPVALDLEAGSYSYSPSGSLAYAKAWRDAVQGAGYLAYIYSNPTGINGLYDGGVKFDGAWPASWFFSTFHTSKPDDLDQLGTRYTHHNRAWQYAGDFAVSGAGSVDGDASDLLLAPEPGGSNL